MIKVRYTETNNRLTHIRVQGHAESGEPGHDLVCAAVSAVTIGALNALKEEDAYDINIDHGYVQVFLIGEPNAHDDIVLETLLISLQTIVESEPEYISLKPFTR